MEQEGLGQILPPFHGNENKNLERGQGWGGEGDVCSLLASVVVVWKIL